MKISEIVYINVDGKRLSISEKGSASIYGERSSSNYHNNIKDFAGQTIGVEWTYQDKAISVFCENDKSLNAYITPDAQYMIVIYKRDSNLFPSPNNCVLYNADGSIYRVLQFPTLISKEGVLYKNDTSYGCFIEGMKWVQNMGGNIDVAIIVVFAGTWYETRMYDYRNDEFKECIEEGRY